MASKSSALLLSLAAAAWSMPALADWTDATCEIYPKGSDKMEKSVPCSFGQRQGNITITREDGVTHELVAVGDSAGNYRNQDGDAVYRQKGLGDMGQIFRFDDISLFVYWDNAVTNPTTEDNATEPFATKQQGGDFDATTLLRCKASGDDDYGSCPAGVSRMDDGQASVTVQDQSGKQFTINFMTDYVNATGGEITTKRDGDTWVVTRANGDIYEVPLAAIEGG